MCTTAYYVLGFTIFVMMLIIIGLAVALYWSIRRNRRFRLNLSNSAPRYIRQESTGVTPLYSNNYDEKNKNNGSTLTVNSGIIEISEPRISEPVTPTRLEDSKTVSNKKVYKPIVPQFQKGQMDAICREVLSKVQKSDSASFRDLNELLKSVNKSEEECEIIAEYKDEEKEHKSEESVKEEKESTLEVKDEPKLKMQPNITVALIHEIRNRLHIENKKEKGIDNKTELTDELVNETVKTEQNVNKTEENTCDTKQDLRNNVQIEIDNVDDQKSTEESETEYDTVPSPVRYRNSGAETDDDIDDIPVYDLPPRRSQEGSPRAVIHMEKESIYLLPLSAEKTDSCYINAKKNKFNVL